MEGIRVSGEWQGKGFTRIPRARSHGRTSPFASGLSSGQPLWLQDSETDFEADMLLQEDAADDLQGEERWWSLGWGRRLRPTGC
jgi:hypothetical protein